MLVALALSVLIGFAVSCIAFVASTVFLHRGLAHRAVTFKRPVAEIFRFLVWITTGIRPRQWVAVHRKHHAFTDIEGDPHSPVLLGWFKVQRSNVALYRREAHNEQTLRRYAKDLQPTRADRWFYDHALFGLSIGIGVLVVVFGPLIGLLAAFVHVNIYLGGSAAVNAVAHHFDRRPYPNRAGNLQWLALITAGEGLHNNHHAAPTSARLSHRWFEVDPGWWVIRTLILLRLAKVRLTELPFVSVKRAAASASVGHVDHGDYIDRCQPDHHFRWNSVAPPELLGQLRAHVPPGDACGPVEQLVGVGRRRRGSCHGHERERRSVVVEAHCHAAVAQDRLALDRVGGRYEHDLVPVEVDPHRGNVRTAVEPCHRHLASSCRQRGHEALPPTLRRSGVAHRARRYSRPHADRVSPVRRERRDAPSAGAVDTDRPHRRHVLDGGPLAGAGHVVSPSRRVDLLRRLGTG